MNPAELKDAVDWDALVRESDGDLPNDVSDAVLLAQYRAAKRRAGNRRTVWRWFAVLSSIAIVGALLATCGALPASADNSWINWGGYKSPIDGTRCCGVNDCFVIPASDVKATPGGYLLKSGELVPYMEAQPSEDQEYWRCKRYDGTRRCFFSPQPGS